MPNRWRLSSFLTDPVEIVHRSVLDPRSLAHATEPPPPWLRALLDRAVATEQGRRALREMYALVQDATTLRMVNGPRAEDLRRAVVPALVRAFRRGDLMLLGRGPRHHNTGTIVQHTPPESEPPPPPPPREELTWIEIELVNEDDTPVAGQRYEIVLPDGSVRSGRLNQQGFARVDGIDSGNCTVTFPDLDTHAWENA